MKLRNNLGRTKRNNRSSDASLNNQDDEEENYSRRMIKHLKDKAGVISSDSPYKTALDVQRSYAKENKMKWLNTKTFIPFIGKKTIDKNFDPLNCYVRLAPSIPPANYRFRQNHKEKWIITKDFKKDFK